MVGVGGDGTPCRELDASQRPHFDEATLTPKLRRYLPSRLDLATRWFENAGSPLALIYVGPNPSGCAIFEADGQYEGDAGNTVCVFRAGDIFARNGTRSERLDQDGLEEVIRRRVRHEKEGWIAEREEVYRQGLAQLEAAYESRNVAAAPLGALSFDLDSESLAAAAIDLVRRQDTIPLTKLLADATNVASSLLGKHEFEVELADVLDKLICLAATFLTYEVTEWFDRTVDALAALYDLGLDDEGQQFSYETRIQPDNWRPLLWLGILGRVSAVGALAVRTRKWAAVRLLAETRPTLLADYYGGWLRHGLTMASRASLLQEEQEGRERQTEPPKRRRATHRAVGLSQARPGSPRRRRSPDEPSPV